MWCFVSHPAVYCCRAVALSYIHVVKLFCQFYTLCSHLFPCLLSDDVFADIEDPAWMARLSLPLTADYHKNMFVPNGPPSSDTHCSPDTLDSSSFSTFGKTPEKDGPLDGALLSEVNTLFNMLLTQKGDSQSRPSPDVLYRLSAAYRRSLGLDGAANAPRISGNPEKTSPLAQCSAQFP